MSAALFFGASLIAGFLVVRFTHDIASSRRPDLPPLEPMTMLVGDSAIALILGIFWILGFTVGLTLSDHPWTHP